MADSSNASSSGHPTVQAIVPGRTMPKAIGSLAKKQDDVTRQGTTKMKFVPVLPTRRKKPEGDVKQEEKAATTRSAPKEGRGRGRGSGRGAEGRGGAPSRSEMIASGPFAMGPAMSGTSARRTAPRSNFTPIIPLGPSRSSALGAGLTKTDAPTLKREPHGQEHISVEDVEVYSDPDEGVEIVDLDDVKRMDWMAPESLGREKALGKKKKKNLVKTEPELDDKGVLKDVASTEVEQIDLANALDLSESEEEEEMEGLMEDFALDPQDHQDPHVNQERLYLFQFPVPFPVFEPSEDVLTVVNDVSDDMPEGQAPSQKALGKKVAFAPDTKPDIEIPSPDTLATLTPPIPVPAGKGKEEDSKIDGVVGQLEIYQSGAVKMRLGNNMLYDIAAATQPSFLQHAVHLDIKNKRLCVLGEVTRRFVASPNIEALLEVLNEDEIGNDR